MARRVKVSPEPGAGTQRLWAPWRAAYLAANATRRPRCIFCVQRLDPAALRGRLILHAGPRALVMLNRYPYNAGHLMVAPRRHVASPELLRHQERATLADLVAFAIERLREVLRPAGFNVGANLGRAAGAGFAGHLHWHVVPRWEGDTNFMPVIVSTRVISQRLEDSYALLAPHFKGVETALS